MRSLKTLLIAALVLSMASVGYAELQNVEVGGSLRIRGNSWDEDSHNANFVEQRTRINVNAEFTDNVRVFIEVDDYGSFGSDLRDDAYTGDSALTGGAGNVSLYQGYIEASDMWDTAIRARIGRQEISLGSEWLIGTNDANSSFTGLSFDAVRLTYATDDYSVDGVWAKLADTVTSDFGDGDTDLYAIYGSYTGIEDITIDAYWMMVRSDGTAAALAVGGDADLHTVGLRGAGNVGSFDYEAEIAFQFGDIDGGTDFDGIGLNTELGYTFDANYEPRIHLGYALLGGPDGNDTGFVRAFSNWEYSKFLANNNLSNVWLVSGGVSMSPTESIDLSLDVSYFEVDEETAGSDEDLGLETDLRMDYQYSEDLSFSLGWAHFFAGDGMEDLNTIRKDVYSGFPGGIGAGGFTGLTGSGSDEGFDYLYFETRISF
jgi:hypothetical protein